MSAATGITSAVAGSYLDTYSSLTAGLMSRERLESRSGHCRTEAPLDDTLNSAGRPISTCLCAEVLLKDAFGHGRLNRGRKLFPRPFRSVSHGRSRFVPRTLQGFHGRTVQSWLRHLKKKRSVLK